MVDFIIHVVGCIILWMAVDYKRTGDSKIKIFGKDWWTLIILVVIGVVMVRVI